MIKKNIIEDSGEKIEDHDKILSVQQSTNSKIIVSWLENSLVDQYWKSNDSSVAYLESKGRHRTANLAKDWCVFLF